jgi:hypothetical protein
MGKNKWQRKVKLLVTIMGIITAIVMGTLPLLRMIVSPELAVLQLTIGSIAFGITLVLMIISLLISPQLILKLTLYLLHILWL